MCLVTGQHQQGTIIVSRTVFSVALFRHCRDEKLCAWLQNKRKNLVVKIGKIKSHIYIILSWKLLFLNNIRYGVVANISRSQNKCREAGGSIPPTGVFDLLPE
jgi:hypothetical protein